MKTLTLPVPDTFDLDKNEVLMLIATKLYEKGNLSLGQAAELAGLSKSTFAELLSKYNVSIFNFPANDLIEDVANAWKWQYYHKSNFYCFKIIKS